MSQYRQTGLGLIPVAAVVGIVSALGGSKAATTEAHIQDRVAQYQSFTDDKLRAIITQYGGEMGEAAKRVLQGRGSPVDAPKEVTVTVPPTAVSTTAAPAAFDWKNPYVLGGIALVGGLLLFAMMRKR